MSEIMLDQFAENPDFGNIEPGNPETFGKGAEFLRDTIMDWDKDKGFLENLGIRRTNDPDGEPSK